ncbi:hypothetical protein Esti_003242 [Eimeria stiedai]
MQYVHQAQGFAQPQKGTGALSPGHLASATALLQQYHAELQQQQQQRQSAAGGLVGSMPLAAAAELLQAHPRDAPKASAATDIPNFGSLRGAEAELQALLDVASGALVNNSIDFALLSFEQRQALATLVRHKQAQLQQLSQHADLLLHQLDENRDGFLDISRLLLLFPGARLALEKTAGGAMEQGKSDPLTASSLWSRAAYEVGNALQILSVSSSGPALSHVGAASPTVSLESLETPEQMHHEHEQEAAALVAAASQPFIRSNARSRTSPAGRGLPENWVKKVVCYSETYSSSQGSEGSKRGLSGTSSLAEAAATTSADTPGAVYEDCRRDLGEGDVSALLGEFALLQAQQAKGGLQSALAAAGAQEAPTLAPPAADPPFFQRNMRRTTTMPNGSLAGRLVMLGGGNTAEGQAFHPHGAANVLSSAAASPLEANAEGSWGAASPISSSRNGRCVRIDTNTIAAAAAAAAAATPDYGAGLLPEDEVTALLGELKLLQEASANVQAAACSPTPGDAGARFQRSNRRTTTLPGTMANIKIRATDVQRVLHTKGRCKPCAFYYNKRKGCRNGIDCGFCHHEEHSKLTLKQWKKHQQRAHRTRVLDECENTEGSGSLSGLQAASVLMDVNEGGLTQAYSPTQVAPPPDVLSHAYALSTSGLSPESLAQVRDRLKELTNAADVALPDGN